MALFFYPVFFVLLDNVRGVELPLMVIYDDSRELNILCNCTD